MEPLFFLLFILSRQRRCHTSFYFKIYSTESMPLSHAAVRLENKDTSRSYSAFSNSHGSVRFPRVRCCNYIVTIKKNGFLPQSFKLKICRCCCKYITLSRQTTHPVSHLYGVISDNQQNKITNAYVILYQIYQNLGRSKLIPIRFTRTDRFGEYDFVNLSKGCYLVKAIK